MKAFHYGLSILLGTIVFLTGCSSATQGTAQSAGQTKPSCLVTQTDLSLGKDIKAQAPSYPNLAATSLMISGSSALAPLITRAANNFMASNPQVQITVKGNGSRSGLIDLEGSVSQLGMSDVAYTDLNQTHDFTDLIDNKVAVVAFTLVVSADIASHFHTITLQQVQDIYAGKVSNWSQLNGPDEPIVIIHRKTGSGTRATFDQYVMGSFPEASNSVPEQDTTDDVARMMTKTAGAIGYVATNAILTSAQPDALNPVCLDGFGATVTNINRGYYPFWNYEHIYTKAAVVQGSAIDYFLRYVTSDAFLNADLPALGFLRVDQLGSAARATHT